MTVQIGSTSSRQHQAYFTSRTLRPNNLDEFRQSYSVPLRDFNTAGVVAAHLGQRLSQLESKYYRIHHSDVQVNRARVDECLTALDGIVGQL